LNKTMTNCDDPGLPGGVPSPDQIEVLELMQTARGGSPELDARIDCVLLRRVFVCMSRDGHRYVWRGAEPASEPCDAEPGARWSEDVMASLELIPADHNYSIGRRDGVCWAWIQPNDDWTPVGTEYRHDHPLGSGLVVAYTMSLASMAAAMIIMRSGVGSARFHGAPRND
jgi:hypothetical protein